MNTDHESAVDFGSLLWFAERANAAYLQPEEILRRFSHVVHVGSFADTDIQYFLEPDAALGTQTLTVRGTDNLANVLLDLEYAPVRDSDLDIWVHRGFDAAARQVFDDVLPLIDSAQPIQFTGHSLGAAVATLLMMYFHNRGAMIGPSTNFGQPKITTRSGANAYSDLPLTRVIDEKDPVPMVPPVDLIDSRHGEYCHFGNEILLLNGAHYSSLRGHDALRRRVRGFWQRILHERPDDHAMDNYIKRIRQKLRGATWVPWNRRAEFE